MKKLFENWRGFINESDIADKLEAEYPGVELWIGEKHGGEAYAIDKIIVPKEQRQSGVGTEVMNKIVQWADANDKILTLTPDNSYGGSKTRLVQFYKRFGFKSNQGRKKNYKYSDTMIRYPNRDKSLEENQFQLPPEILSGDDHSDEEEGLLVKNIPIKMITMLKSQGEAILRDIQRGEVSRTSGLPVLWYDLEKEQLIVDDGNHRIFQDWLAGKNHIDAIVYSSNWHGWLRSVLGDEERFGWDEDYRN